MARQKQGITRCPSRLGKTTHGNTNEPKCRSEDGTPDIAAARETACGDPIRDNAPMGTVLLDQVETDYGQFDLGWDVPFGFDGNFDRFFAGQLNGLVRAADSNGVYLALARRSGGSRVRIELLEHAAGSASETWEDIVEVSVVVPERSHLGGPRGPARTGSPCPFPPDGTACA